MLGSLLALAVAAAPDVPRTVTLLPETGALALVSAASGPLAEARKLAEQLRYEEAVVEYQKYLALPERPTAERAQALLELGFLHLVLGDEATAEARAQEALELDPTLTAEPGSPPKQVEFLTKMRRRAETRARLAAEPRQADDAPTLVRVSLADPEGKVKRVLARHATQSHGPFASVELTCEAGACQGTLPRPKDASSSTAWYYFEALDAAQGTLARAGTPETPFQLAVVDEKPWYTKPVVWAIAGAALVGVAAVGYTLAPAPPK
jgi:tetratricopeptide (TPR) repeat protein